MTQVVNVFVMYCMKTMLWFKQGQSEIFHWFPISHSTVNNLMKPLSNKHFLMNWRSNHSAAPPSGESLHLHPVEIIGYIKHTTPTFPAIIETNYLISYFYQSCVFS